MVDHQVAFLFPGQGSQYVGMGKDLWENFAVARDTFQEADEALGFALSALCFEGPDSELTLTANAQPAILTVSVAALRAMLSETDLRPSVLAGHSLGEYSALVASSALSFANAVKLVRARGRFMQEAVPEGRGKMAAILGLDGEKVADLCRLASHYGVVTPANYNAPGQVVISGEGPAVDAAGQAAVQDGAKKVIPLSVSAPFHCPLMRPAGKRLAQALESVKVTDPGLPVIANVDAEPNLSGERVRELLVRQVSSPVLWEQSMKRMAGLGVSKAVEIGPGKVLSGLLKRTCKEVEVANVEDKASLIRIASPDS